MIASVDPASPPPPRVVGRYALYDAIAAGGMATVHLGRLVGHAGFERTVAIKRLHPQFVQDPEFVSMFLDEARVVARIRHPNVVPTLDVVNADGELFIVMEYVQGESLSRLIKATGARGTRIPPDLAAAMLAGVLHGLHAAHEAKNERGEPLDVVHRDISPQNILVGTDGVARVLDFGVAKAAGRIQTTREGQLKGKIAYMAPEQISGVVARTTDVYAASVVLWEVLTGRRLFAGENEAHIMKLVLESRIAPPSTHVPELPPALDAVVMRGLSYEASDRFPTAKDMAIALEEAMPAVAVSKIGAWVEATASKTLVDRSERIAAIESNSSLLAPARSPSPTVGSAPVVTQAVPTAPVMDDIQTQLSSSSVSTAGPALLEPRRARPRFLLVAASGAAIVAAILVAFTMRRGTRDVPTQAVDVPAASPGPASALPDPTAAISAPTAAASSSSVLTPAAPPSASASSVAPSTPHRWRGPVQKPAPARLPGVDDGTADRK